MVAVATNDAPLAASEGYCVRRPVRGVRREKAILDAASELGAGRSTWCH